MFKGFYVHVRCFYNNNHAEVSSANDFIFSYWRNTAAFHVKIQHVFGHRKIVVPAFPLILYLITTAETSDDFCCVRRGTKQMVCKSATKRQGSQWFRGFGIHLMVGTLGGTVSSYCSLVCVLIDCGSDVLLVR